MPTGDPSQKRDDDFHKVERGRNSTFFTYTLRVDGNDFRAANLTIENSAGIHVGPCL